MNAFNDKTLLLKQGKCYDLSIVKIMTIAADQNFYLARDKNGLNHLIPVKYYCNYGIRAGDTVKCRLDRINCQGRFFFEPEHPVYRTGSVYMFDLLRFVDCSSDNKSIYAAIVVDYTGTGYTTLEFEVSSELPCKISSVLCRVELIKKSRLSLRLVDKRILS